MKNIPDLSLPYNKMDQINIEISKQYSEFFENYLLENLKLLGYKFKSREHFLQFLIHNCIRVENAEDPDYFSFYIKPSNPKKANTYIGGLKRTITQTQARNFVFYEITYLPENFKPFQTDL